jgi:hypothetical protein
MKNVLLLFNVLSSLFSNVLSFNLLDLYNRTRKIDMYPCLGLNKEIISTINDITTDYNQLKFHQLELHTGLTYALGFNNINTICHMEDKKYFGLMRYDNLKNYNDTDIFINKVLLNKPNTLYNVLYHEVLHSIGLDHSNKSGFMNYSVLTDIYGNIINDRNRYYMSIDDFKGVRYLYRKYTRK